MTTVSVSALKANLSHYLREVRRGGEVQVLDRGVPVARLIPSGAEPGSARERLIASGLMRAGRGRAAAILDQPPLELPASLSEALDREREDLLGRLGHRPSVRCAARDRVRARMARCGRSRRDLGVDPHGGRRVR